MTPRDVVIPPSVLDLHIAMTSTQKMAQTATVPRRRSSGKTPADEVSVHMDATSG